jgi:hypothetical protein
MSNGLAALTAQEVRGPSRVDRVVLAACGLWFLIATIWGFTGTLRLIPNPSGLHLATKLHGVAFAAWVLLFALQASLAASGRYAWHRTIAWSLVPIVAVMLPTGYWTVVRAMVLDRRTILEGSLLLASLTLGFVLVALGVCMRRRCTSSHAAALLLATVVFTSLAVDRVSFLAGFADQPWLVTLVRIAPAATVVALAARSGKTRVAALASTVIGALIAIDRVGVMYGS